MREIRFGMAGLGVGARQVLYGFQIVEGAKFTAAADVREDELKVYEKKFGVQTFTSVEEMAKSDACDVIWVATPNNFHAEHAILAANHGKHVICEKPMATTMEEADRICEAIEKNGVRYVQGHSKIYNTFVPAMGEIISSGQIGRPIQITIMTYNDWTQRPWESHTLDPKRSGGVVYRQGPHQLDMVRYLAGGMARSVRASVGAWHPQIDVHGDYSAFFEFESGVTALATFNGYGNFDTMELTFNRGEGGGVRPESEMATPRPRSTGPMPVEEFYDLPENDLDRMLERGLHGGSSDVTQSNFFGLMVVSCERGDMRQHPEGLYLYTERGRELIKVPARPGAEVREMVAALNEGRPTFPDHNWGRASLECCIGMIESARQRKEIYLTSQSPSPVKMPEPLKPGGSPDRYAQDIWH
jgi:phthalate 4,5-cis-dihydrodiol dehydrogenase